MPNQPPSPYPRRRSPLLQLDPGLEDQPGGVRPEPSLPPQVAPPVPGVRGGAPELTGVERRSMGMPTLNVRNTYTADYPAVGEPLPEAPLVSPDLRRVAKEGGWLSEALGTHRDRNDELAAQGPHPQSYDRRVESTPDSVAVAPAPVFDQQQVMKEQPAMIQGIVKMLQGSYDALTPEQRAADPFWATFTHMPEYAAASMLNTMFSNLVAPGRGAQGVPMSTPERQAWQAHPVQQFADWANYPNWFRNVGGRT